MKRIKQVSKAFRVLFQIAFVGLVIMVMLGAVNLFSDDMIFKAFVNMAKHSYPVLHKLSPTTKALEFLINLIPSGIQFLILYFLIKLFKLYEKGEIFAIQNVKYIKNIGYSLVAGQLLTPVHDALLSLVLTWANPPHQHYIQITFDQTNVGVLLTGILVILISWIMAEGYKLNEEHQLTV